MPKNSLQMKEHLPPGIEIVEAENFDQWLMDIRVLDANPLYTNQIFRLKLIFSSKYPIGMYLHYHKPTFSPLGLEYRKES